MALPQITWQDLQQLPDDGKRYEAIEGDLYVTPAPSIRHQRISMRLVLALDELLVQPGHGELFHAPVGVEFPATEEGVQPDVVFVSKARRGILAEKWMMGPPDVVIEILSPGTARRDRGIKLRLYERQRVPEYWIVDPENDAIDVWRFELEPRHERFTASLPVRLGDESIGDMDLTRIFARG
ncbi:MAG TPA: Uma2 family endonuclease [Gemmatimonadota bacterium]|nr:Uma2 family endonuclease [Gemmatimonadota bacterium]